MQLLTHFVVQYKQKAIQMPAYFISLLNYLNTFSCSNKIKPNFIEYL